MSLILKAVITAVIVVAISEAGRRSSLIGGLLAALPVTSILAFIWLYRDTGDPQKVGQLALDIFWMVLPTLPFFLLLPWFLRLNLPFPLALALASVIIAAAYPVYISLLRGLGVVR